MFKQLSKSDRCGVGALVAIFVFMLSLEFAKSYPFFWFFAGVSITICMYYIVHSVISKPNTIREYNHSNQIGKVETIVKQYVYNRCSNGGVGSDMAASIILSDASRYILKNHQILTNHITSGKSARECAICLIMNLTATHISSGKYHIYRGVLDTLGPGLAMLKLFKSCVDELLHMGVITQEAANLNMNNLADSINEVG